MKSKPQPKKKWRVEVVILERGKERIMSRVLHGTYSGVRQIGLLIKGAVRIHDVVEIEEGSSEVA